MKIEDLLAEKGFEKKLESLSFEEGMALLETLVVQVERGEMPLEDSLRAYERGVALTRRLEMHLDIAQKRIDALKEDKG